MIRYPSLLLIFLILFTGISVYEIKSIIIEKQQIVSKLEREVLKKKENIKILKAEFSYISRPQRIEEIAKNYLNMKIILPIDIWNIKDFAKIKIKDVNDKN